jgi:hypothetical protein
MAMVMAMVMATAKAQTTRRNSLRHGPGSYRVGSELQINASWAESQNGLPTSNPTEGCACLTTRNDLLRNGVKLITA